MDIKIEVNQIKLSFLWRFLVLIYLFFFSEIKVGPIPHNNHISIVGGKSFFCTKIDNLIPSKSIFCI